MLVVDESFLKNDLLKADLSLKKFATKTVIEINHFPIDTKSIESMQTSLNSFKEFAESVKELEDALNNPKVEA